MVLAFIILFMFSATMLLVGYEIYSDNKLNR